MAISENNMMAEFNDALALCEHIKLSMKVEESCAVKLNTNINGVRKNEIELFNEAIVKFHHIPTYTAKREVIHG